MITAKQMKFIGERDIDKLPQLKILSEAERQSIKIISKVLPFRANNYVVEELIDWNNVPDDPIFRLTFPTEDMLNKKDFQSIYNLVKTGASQTLLNEEIKRIRYKLNPHPAGQLTANVPVMDDGMVNGVQHKYKETCLVFPSSGQTCHAYCTFCFRWAQFVGMTDIKIATDESKKFQEYIAINKEITDILYTGGDPMVMSAEKLKAYLEPLLEPEFEHVQNIRIGTKALSYWPYRFVTDKDADDILALFEKLVKAGKHLSVMAHFNHWVELSTDIVKEAIVRIRNTGAEIRTQSPVIRHINDDADVWAKMWQEQVKLGCIPYYMFVERDTGAHEYFAVSLSELLNIFRDAYTQVSGLARTVRGPSMSTTPGKVVVEGIAEINGEKVFVLNFIQARNPAWVKRPFFAVYDESATWLDELRPAFGEEEFFFEEELAEILAQRQEEINFSK